MPEKFDFRKIEDQERFNNLPIEEKQEMNGQAEEEEREKKLIQGIQQMIVNEEVAMHCPSYLLGEIIAQGPEGKRVAGVRSEGTLIDELKGFFKHGIWSKRKLFTHGEGKISGFGGYGAEKQETHAGLLAGPLDKILLHIEKQKAVGVEIEDITYEKMLNDPDFLSDKDIEWVSRYYPEFLSSPRTRFAFERMKQDDWQKDWKEKGDSDRFYPYSSSIPEERREVEWAMRNMNDVLYGRNLISSTPPKRVREFYEKEGIVEGGYYDSMAILFKVPKNTHSSKMSKEDLGIANRVPANRFVAIVIKHRDNDPSPEKIDLNQIPKEFFDAIPDNIPIITTDFKVIRMPKDGKN